MGYKNEWFLLEADDDIDEIEHREPTEEFLFYRAVATGDVETVKKNCEQIIKDENNITTGQLVTIMGSGLVGALVYTFIE